MARQNLILQLEQYNSGFPVEMEFKTRFIKLLVHPDCFHRHHLPGHLTGSSWIIDHTKKYVLLTHHAKLNKWLQPGGHADGDENVLSVAMREAEEETGLTNLTVNNDIFDIDIHEIPARGDMPAHDHFDIRFLFYADKNEPLMQNHESNELRWVKLDDVDSLTNGNESIMRMVEKIKTTSH